MESNVRAIRKNECEVIASGIDRRRLAERTLDSEKGHDSLVEAKAD